MKNVRELKIWSLILFFFLFSSSCQNRIDVPPPGTENEASPQSLSQTLKFDIYVDATQSMMGFVQPGLYTVYGSTIGLLEEAIMSGWSDETISFFKFGDEIEEIDRQVFLSARWPNFYIKKPIALITQIDRVIESANPQNSSLIITDFFQQDSDVTRLIRAVRDNIIQKNLAIGVLGIRSEFNGEVFDIGIQNLTFPYFSHQDDPGSFRPFYILMLGQHRDIIHLNEQLGEKLREAGFDQSLSKFTLFSPYIVEKISTFEDCTTFKTDKIDEIRSILPLDIATNSVKQFRLRKSIDDANLAFSLNCFLQPNSAPFSKSVPEKSGQ